MELMTAGLTAALSLPAMARAERPDFGPCAGFIASAPDRRRTWIRGEAPAGRPFRLDSPFRVASVSKMVAASVIVPIATGLPGGLDADVSDRVGFRLRHPAWPERPIRLRHLLSHTSGLRNGPSYPVLAGRLLSSAFAPGSAQFDEGG
jgi:CubicO group peptidase (beta-lactamase class C family)